MEFDLPTTGAAFILVIALGIGGMAATPMGMNTILMMVAPSMIVFGLIMLALGVKHGEYRAVSR
ncbi:hypothetical protein ACFR99_02655 [Haloarchaeobius amylolyticus]|uniref:Uncharacterized protein n=1 Tax=Haloarchaeobius amylolyticus TaxID=1198296 RepID=A0ABD6BBM1_9EURY